MFQRDILIFVFSFSTLYLTMYRQIIVRVLKTTEDKIKGKMNSSLLKALENSLLLLFLIN